MDVGNGHERTYGTNVHIVGRRGDTPQRSCVIMWQLGLAANYFLPMTSDPDTLSERPVKTRNGCAAITYFLNWFWEKSKIGCGLLDLMKTTIAYLFNS